MANFTMKTIEKYGVISKTGYELRYVDVNGTVKYDIRQWYTDSDGNERCRAGIRLTKEQLQALYDASQSDLTDEGVVFATHGSQELHLKNYKGKYNICVFMNGYPQKGNITLEADEANTLCSLISEILGVEGEPKKIETPKATTTTKKKTKKAEEKQAVDFSILLPEEKKVEEKKPEYENAFDKYTKQFEAYRETQPENMRKGYKMMHDIVCNHIKDVAETSEEYEANAMRDGKNSHDLMAYLQSKAFENPEATMGEDAEQNICIWIDEYIGSPVPEKKTTTTKKTTGTKKTTTTRGRKKGA